MTVAHNTLLAFVFASFSAAGAWAGEDGTNSGDTLFKTAIGADLNEFVWKKRPIIVFADSEDDPAFIEQMKLLEERQDPLRERDVVVLFDTDPETLSDVRKRMRPRGFMLTILSKEGRVQARKPFPWNVREISRSIDKLPIRKREIRDAKAESGG